MKRISIRVLLTICLTTSIFFLHLEAQVYPNHFGTGNDIGVTVTSSSTEGDDSPEHTLNGTGFFPDLEGGSRFLGQASLGANYEDIDYVTQIGIEAWLDEQLSITNISYRDKYQEVYDSVAAKISAVHGAFTPDRRRDYLQFAFYEKVLRENDVLRNKVAFALSQIFVVSISDNVLDDRSFGTSSYYDILYGGAFDNFRDLLGEITLHPAMGIYLSHFQNVKANPTTGTLPDENFAREIMQLFTIGLFELNNDGTYKLDANGEKISTYDIVDIQELAKVFTGLSGSAWDLILRPENAGTPVTPNKGLNHYDLTAPMAMYSEYHETGPKTMIDGSIIPANQSGMQDIDDALDVLFNHPNVGPFFSVRMIQQLVKSNPTPAYVNRVASVFNNNGYGVRGDIGAVVKAILTDSEARDCSWINDSKAGKLKQPVERSTNLFLAFDIDSPSGHLWYRDLNLTYQEVEQSFLAAPTVFNFFSPFYAEDSYVAPNNMVSPEFEILHAVTGISYINLIEEAIKIRPFKNRTGVNNTSPALTKNNVTDEPFLDFTDELAIYNSTGLSDMIDRIDLILCHGQLSSGTKTIITDAINQFTANNNNYTDQSALDDVLYFIMMSPDYLILK